VKAKRQKASKPRRTAFQDEWFLGLSLATIGLTVPAMLAVSYISGREVFLGLEKASNMLLLPTLAVCVVTFASGRTNILQGAVHVMLFAAFVMLIFQG